MAFRSRSRGHEGDQEQLLASASDRVIRHSSVPATGHATLYATPLFLALAMVETADIVFAVDSVPAIFAVTRDPFVVYTSNVFAILGYAPCTLCSPQRLRISNI
ncbi:TerC family protein [Sinorhizobium meliloti]|uniref:TerC family protein n=1 Tax=Rhizobium meliloti TaxID=382 RepID=UPI003D09CB6D